MQESQAEERRRRFTAAAARSAWAGVPTALTRARLLSIPVLWALALLRMPEALAIGAAIAAATDVLDGFIARRFHVASRRGAALDSAADHLLSISLVIWMVTLRPHFLSEQWLPLGVWGAFALGVLAFGWMRRGQAVNLHLYSAKVAGSVGYLFALILLYTGRYTLTFFWIALTLATLAALEALIVIATRRTDDHGGSILLRRRPR